ncbi:hypothetical protein HDU81_010661 [Chytriomyces hyalinus]|nr:hypothetical protein HDU81_010661 [Chytriomyces hyalinus]
MDLDSGATLRRIDDTATFRRDTGPTTLQQTSMPERVEQSGLGATVMGLDWWAKAALIWSVLQLLVLLVAQGLVLKSHYEELSALTAINASHPDYLYLDQSANSVLPNAQALSIYEIIFLFGQFFQTYLAFDAIITSSKIQLVASAAFNVGLFGDSVAQYIQADNLISVTSVGTFHFQNLQLFGFAIHRTSPFEIAVIVLSAIFLIGWTFFVFKLYNIFGWSVFKELGADVEVRKRLTVYHIYMMLLKIDVFFFVSFVVQYVLLAFPEDGIPKTVTAIFSPIGVVALLFIAYYAVTRESNLLMTFLLIGLSGGIGYLVDRVIDIWTVSDITRYKSCKISLTMFTTVTILVSLATFGVAVLNFLNFGKGLMTALKNKKGGSTIDRSLELNSIANSGSRSNGYGSSGYPGQGTGDYSDQYKTAVGSSRFGQ